MKISLLTLFLILLSFSVFGQTEYKNTSHPIRKIHVFDPMTSETDFNASLRNMEAPSPDGDSYKSFLMRQKIEARKQFPVKKAAKSVKNKINAADPIIGKGFSMYSTLANGRQIDYSGGIPNDNALAVSNGGIVLGGINNIIWGYDLNTDTTIFPKHIKSLRQVCNGSSSANYYDPKMIYDEKADRFILVFLRDNTPQSSAFIVCFSTTNNPRDEWNVYEIDGNPLNNNRWTDFPAINITENELFITGNLIIPNVSWQVGFDGSVIWQVNKHDGFAGADSIRNKLFSDIRFNGAYTRNLHPVRGTASNTDRQFFLSNRNFDVTNDTIFLLEVTGTLDNSTLDVKMGKTAPSYGVPPNGRQADTDLNNPTKGLQTNDARVLGAITNGDWIQFVSTTMDTSSGFAAIYHGTISDPGTAEQKITGHIIGDTVRDYGYPNIAFTGNEACDIETIIGFNYTSPTDFAGVAAVYYGNDGSYSDVVTLKQGLNYTDAHSDSYERWGDYFGIQPKFDEPGKVWTAGYYGLTNRQNGTWFNELISPDDSELSATGSATGDLIFCKGQFELTPQGGTPPYQFSFDGVNFSENSILEDICDGDTITYTLIDSRGCILSDTILNARIAGNATATFPNPFSSNIVTQFDVNTDKIVSAYIYDTNGKLVSKILERRAVAGLNQLVFDLSPLKAGIYVLKVVAGDNEEILVNKIFKRE